MPKGPTFEKIASHIRGGSIPWMERVVENWPPSGNQIQLFDAFQPHFSVPAHGAIDAIVSEGNGEWQETKRRAQLASSALRKLLKSGSTSSSPRLKATLAERIVATLDRIVWWQTELYVNGNRNLSAVGRGKEIMGFLCATTSLMDTLAHAIRSSPSAIELAAIALTVDCPTADIMEDPTDHRPILSLTSLLLFEPASRSLLLDSIYDHGSSHVDCFVTKVVNVADFILGYGYMSQEAMQMISHLGDVLQHVSEDPRYREALREHNYVNRFLRCAIPQFRLSTRGASKSHATRALHWIKTHQPRRHRSTLIIDFILNGGLHVIINTFSQSNDQAERKIYKDMMESFLGFTSSRRVCRAIAGVLEDVSNARWEEERWRGTQWAVDNLTPPWEDFSSSFEARSPAHEVNYLLVGEKERLAFCNNVTHHTTTLSPEYKLEVQQCSRCHAVAYCCEACQRADWDAIHYFECRELAIHHAVLEADGFRLTRVASYAFRFTSDLFEYTLERSKKTMEPHSSALEAGNLVYVNRDVNSYGKHSVIPVAQHRRNAECYMPWSPSRFDAVVDFVGRTTGTRLLAFVDPCGDANMHLLCVQFYGTKEFRLVPAMAQIEYI
ncbi:hypothetical protein BKA70DRAFT_450636 [Coprinopsis sp. MPI-PUGE-AT-0042]|nr:hypothetical protein BKA70DRAFT_450636 [Coprinopsis sp. MPI-PUGE-AT-0042]